MDLAVRGSAEQEIGHQLQKPTTLEFTDTPLSDVIDYLKTFIRSTGRRDWGWRATWEWRSTLRRSGAVSVTWN